MDRNRQKKKCECFDVDREESDSKKIVIRSNFCFKPECRNISIYKYTMSHVLYLTKYGACFAIECTCYSRNKSCALNLISTFSLITTSVVNVSANVNLSDRESLINDT